MTTENCLECTERHGTDVDERFHLLAQIKFLHSELERLESQCETIRLNRHRESSESARNTGDIINRKNRELLELRQKYDYLNNVSNKELQKRCTSLEKQLASALSVNAITLNERDELGAKVRKLDSALKSRKTELIEFQLTCAEDIEKKDAEICELSAAVKEAVASAEHALAAQHLSVAVATCNVGTNTESQAVSVLSQTESVILAEKECQVNSEPHFSDLSTQAASTVAHALELKTQECDDIRAKFEDLVSLHEDALHKLGTAHRQLSDETERHKLCNADAEKLGIHLRSLQQRNSEQNTTERDLTSKLLHLEEQLQHLRSESIRGERDRSVLESQIRQYEVDMSQLVQNKNFSNEQLSALANENEQLRAEVQKLLQRESQLAFTLKAKDGELHDIIAAYQNSAKENETTVDNKRALERELDQSNAVLASKQEEIIYLQEQLHALHQREQQLVLDTQTFEYENSQHHRRIIQLEASISQFELRCAEMHQALLAKNQAAEEIHQNLAEVSKELVIKDNECLLMKRHYESLEADATRLQALVVSHEQRQHALEDTNARLVARDILSATTDITAISSDLAACQQELATAKTELLNEVGKKTALKAALRDVELKLKETTQSNDRLKQIVSDQTKALSHLAK